MKVIIIEDESIAIRKLKKIILEINPDVEIVVALESVFDAKRWFLKNELLDIDLIFSDIQLSDGLMFEIFENMDVKTPIIFTTAFDYYTLEAFKLNGVDYLLKPIQKLELKKAMQKLENTKHFYTQKQWKSFQDIFVQFRESTVKYPSFISYKKGKLIPLDSEKIAFFYIQNQIVKAVAENVEFIIEETLDEIEKRLPTSFFFRANRQFIIQKKYILNAEMYFNNRMLVSLTIKSPEDIILSREKTTSFKNWLTGI